MQRLCFQIKMLEKAKYCNCLQFEPKMKKKTVKCRTKWNDLGICNKKSVELLSVIFRWVKNNLRQRLHWSILVHFRWNSYKYIPILLQFSLHIWCLNYLFHVWIASLWLWKNFRQPNSHLNSWERWAYLSLPIVRISQPCGRHKKIALRTAPSGRRIMADLYITTVGRKLSLFPSSSFLTRMLVLQGLGIN